MFFFSFCSVRLLYRTCHTFTGVVYLVLNCLFPCSFVERDIVSEADILNEIRKIVRTPGHIQLVGWTMANDISVPLVSDNTERLMFITFIMLTLIKIHIIRNCKLTTLICFLYWFYVQHFHVHSKIFVIPGKGNKT